MFSEMLEPEYWHEMITMIVVSTRRMNWKDTRKWMVKHSMDDLMHLRDEESDGWMDRETPPYLMATVRSSKEFNECLMRAHAEQVELNFSSIADSVWNSKASATRSYQCWSTVVIEVENSF
jgi:hypothetical protein